MTRGRHFALTEEDELLLIKCSEAGRPDLIGSDIEERYLEQWYCDTDKAWDAIHRAFNSGALTYDFDTPLQGVILGGVPLYSGTDYIISLKTGLQVKQIAETLSPLEKQRFGELYYSIDEDQYGEALSEADFDYSWYYLSELKPFYARAASAVRSVVFTAPQ